MEIIRYVSRKNLDLFLSETINCAELIGRADIGIIHFRENIPIKITIPDE